jgi:tetratricopeptide (TPR) repeat protein
MRIAKRIGMVNQDFLLIVEAGFAMLSAGRIQEALDIFEGCLEMLPDSELPLIGLARCYASVGKLQRAEDLARRAMKVKFRSPIARMNLAEILLMRGKKEEGIEMIKTVNDDNPESPLLEWKRAMLMLLGQDEEDYEKNTKKRLTKKQKGV